MYRERASEGAAVQARESQPAKKPEHVPGNPSGRGREGAPRNRTGGERGKREEGDCDHLLAIETALL